MNDEQAAGQNPDRPADDSSVDTLLSSLADQLRAVMSNVEQVEEYCSKLKGLQSAPPNAADAERLIPFLPLLAQRSGPEVPLLFDLIEHTASSVADPWPLLKGMLCARDRNLVKRSLQLARRSAEEGRLEVDREVVSFFAQQAQLPESSLTEGDLLPLLMDIVRHLKTRGHAHQGDLLADLFLGESDAGTRDLAARLLDIPGNPVPLEFAAQVLEQDAFTFLSPYLLYTRATHRDLLSLLASEGKAPPALADLRHAHDLLGEVQLRQIIGEIGWPRLNLGLDIRQYELVTSGDSVPLLLHPAEVKLARRCGDVQVAGNVVVVTAHGGPGTERQDTRGALHPASRFREYNLLHAEVLEEFLTVAPLTRERALRILEKMDRIVSDFCGLFSSLTEECSILSDVYGTVQANILAELGSETDEDHLSLELTRLVMMFEDPLSLGQVQTLHGLKRYLHQKGLQLGFRLMQGGRSTNRTIDLLLLSNERILHRYRGIRYADFEPTGDPEQSTIRIPYPVRIVVDGFARQALLGQGSFPRVDIFCYGNEVHCFLAFRNHPAFLRINYAPPLQGGMVDLEYYGVSKYEIAEHPDLSLEALQQFFRSLGFDVQMAGTRVHARYDKEQAPDLQSLCERAEAMFRLAPYLLDIDWTIGGLNLDGEARRTLRAAWATSFEAWGVLPLRYLLTEDRQGVVESVTITPAGKQEIVWSGRGAYSDRFNAWPADFFSRFLVLSEELNLEVTPLPPSGGHSLVGQILLERSALSSLRKAVVRGELTETADGYRLASSDLFRREAEAEKFAEVIASGDGRLQAAAALATLVAPLERVLPFRTTGSVGAYEVQSARLPLQGSELGIFVLRGEGGAARLAFYTHGTVLYRHRAKPDEAWTSNAQFNASTLLSLIRRANYPTPGIERLQPGSSEEADRIRNSLAETSPLRSRTPVPGERTISGLRASPGRIVGRVVFGTKGRVPHDMQGAVLVTPALRPEDAPFLYHATGVVTTGGGILSHAGLLAAQFRRPALIVAGRWESDDAGPLTLHYASMHYEVEEKEVHGYLTCIRRRIREREHLLREGDLVVLEEREDVLRVLGQDRQVLACHESFRQLGRTALDLSEASNDHDILRLRGVRIRARHQLEKVLQRITDPALTCHAVSELLSGSGISPTETKRLLRLILDNHSSGEIARKHLRWIAEKLLEQSRAATRTAQKRIPDSESTDEILSLRLDALHAHQSLVGACTPLGESGVESGFVDSFPAPTLDQPALLRLAELQRRASERLEALDQESTGSSCRHLLRQLHRIDRLIGTAGEEKKSIDTVRAHLSRSDESARRKLSTRSILWPEDGGLELFGSLGWKAANLAEISRITGRPLVPEWFAVTDRAFQRVLESPVDKILWKNTDVPGGASTLLEAIQAVLNNDRLDQLQRSSSIRSLWEAVVLPQDLVREVLAAYRCLGREESSEVQGSLVGPEPTVALRSSSHEEDAEIATRAGEFDTFLFIRGEDALLDYLKRTWSGLWSERALHHRSILGTSSMLTGGGVIIQRIVDSRVSGVLQTVNLAQNDFRQVVINAGLGLGQGIVSGTVAADHIVVSKDMNLRRGPLHFRYTTAEKKEYVVFDRRAGIGTIQCEAPFHQRRRPALEYAELCELVAVASLLETSYGYPLDIEFGIEGKRLWILQARPVPASMLSFQETIEKHPLTNMEHPHTPMQGYHYHDQA